MRKIFLAAAVLCIIFASSAYGLHKFYVSIYKMEFNQPKKRLEITARIFVDDLNAVLLQRFHTETRIGDKAETSEDVDLMKKYLLDNFKIHINQKPVKVEFLSHELETNVVICYYKVNDVTKLKSADIQNTSLFDLTAEQQNIIQMTVAQKKQNLLLTLNNPSGTLSW